MLAIAKKYHNHDAQVVAAVFNRQALLFDDFGMAVGNRRHIFLDFNLLIRIQSKLREKIRESRPLASYCRLRMAGKTSSVDSV